MAQLKQRAALSSLHQGHSCICQMILTTLVLIVLALPSLILCGFDMNQPADSELDLSLGGGQFGHSVRQLQAQELMNSIMQDQYQTDFGTTQMVLMEVEAKLMEIIATGAANEASVITRLLSVVREGQARQLASSQLISMANELEYIASSFWTQYKTLLVSILEKKPSNMDITQIAFRCDKIGELQNLLQLSSRSMIYQILTETFSSELYVHCLKRKLALIKILDLRPSSIVRQFVDIYLSPPGQIGPPQSGSGIKFNLQESLAMHGPLNAVALQVVGALSTLSHDYHNETVYRFKRDCESYVIKLNQIWSSLDNMANLLSSSMINLVDFNEHVKQLAPQLMYATICSRLAS